MSILNRIAEPDIYNHINFEIMAKIDKKSIAPAEAALFGVAGSLRI
jgi:hypothetical protein